MEEKKYTFNEMMLAYKQGSHDYKKSISAMVDDSSLYRKELEDNFKNHLLKEQ